MIEFPCRDKTWVGVAEALDDKAPLAHDRVCDRTHDACDSTQDAHDRAHSVCSCSRYRPMTVHCLGHCSWVLFTNSVHGYCSKKKVQNFDPWELGCHNYEYMFLKYWWI